MCSKRIVGVRAVWLLLAATRCEGAVCAFLACNVAICVVAKVQLYKGQTGIVMLVINGDDDEKHSLSVCNVCGDINCWMR